MIYEIIREVKSSSVKVVSFDIFDTLIMRHAKAATDIFAKMYVHNPNLFPDYMNEEDWKTLRSTMHRMAIKKHYESTGNYEITLDETYSFLPTILKDRKKIMRCEIDEEISNCFQNRSMYETIKEVKEMGYTVILLSDMYLPSEAIEEILTSCGINSNIFDNIFVSNEYQKSKRFYGLYEVVLNYYKLNSKELYHVGDNAVSDVACAKKLGINTYHYTGVSEALIKYPGMLMEDYTPFDCDKETFSLRVLSAEGSENFWHQIGALYFGPFYTYFAQWIVWEAERNNIRKIRPFMREGDFLSEIISYAISQNHLSINVAPLYVSRMAVFSAGFESITDKEVSYLFEINNITLKEVLGVLRIEFLIDEYADFQDCMIDQLKSMTLDGQSAYETILDRITEPETINIIREKNKNSMQEAIEYFLGMGLDDSSITIDVGWRGYIQSAIDKLFFDAGISSRPKHYLCIAKPDVAWNLYPNSDIRGFLGNFGSNRDLTSLPFARIVELSLQSEKGTTLGYKRNDESIEPVIMQIDYPEWQVKAIKEIQNGIKEFQKNYYMFASKQMLDGSKIRDKAPLLYGIIDRLLKYPTFEEALRLKELMYDQNFGGSGFTSMIDEKDLQNASAMTIENYYINVFENKVIWKSGMNSLLDPFFYSEKLNVIRGGFKVYSWHKIVKAVIELSKKMDERIVLIGAGGNLIYFLYLFSLMGKLDLIEAIWDNSEEKEGAAYCGIEVEKPFKSGNKIFLCTVENLGVEKILFDQIKSLSGDDIVFYGLGINNVISNN